MDKDALGEVLRTLVTSYHNRARPSSRLTIDDENEFLAINLAGPLEDALLRQPEFAGATRMLNMGSGGSGFHPQFIAPALLKRAAEKGVDRVISGLEKVLNTERADLLCITALWGVTVSRRFAISHNVDLMPFSELPESGTKATLERKSHMINSIEQGNAPPAALVSTVEIKPLLIAIEDDHGGETPPELLVASDAAQKHAAIANALTMIGPCGPMIAANWSTFCDMDIDEAVLFQGMTTRSHEIIPRPFSYSSVPISPDAAPFIEAYLGLPEPIRGRIDIALSRLNQAMRRHTVGDKAVDGAIALESLVTDGGDKGEITFRLALRTALLAGQRADERKYIRHLIRKFYEIRSQVVHSGRGPERVSMPDGKVATPEIVDKALQTVAKVLQVVVTRGQIPDWDALELSGN